MTTISDIKSREKIGVQTLAGRFVLGLVLSALSGVMLLLSFPPYGVWWLAWFAFVPGIFAQFRMFPRKYANLAPAIYALVWLGPYMARLFGTQFGPFFTYLGVLIAILIYFLSQERAFIERTKYRWMVLQGVVNWVGFEMIRATFIPLVATSAFIGYTQATQAWLIQPVSIFSVYGMNILVMLINYALAQGLISWVDRRQQTPRALPLSIARNWLVATGAVLAAWIGISLIILNGAPKDASTVRVAALRSGLPMPAHIDYVNDSQMRFDTFARQAQDAAAQEAQILFTSEMMFNFDPQVEYTDGFRAIAAETNTYIFISYSVLKEGEPGRNQAVLLSPDGTFSEVYNKTHIPPGESYDVPGGTFPIFETRFGRMSSLICADGNYTDITRYIVQNGAQLIAAPYREFPGFGEQLWQNITFRAVENRVPMVVTGAASVAAIIDPYGHLNALDVNKDGSEAVLVGDVSLGTGKGTLYTSLGDVLGWVMLAGLIVFSVYQAISDRKAKKATKS
ncbi:MAG: nitrilase-related carbon-nitrogen hydrolase [Anaerolineales bacterium]|jgi:apolipoprotein N-acyltransferase